MSRIKASKVGRMQSSADVTAYTNEVICENKDVGEEENKSKPKRWEFEVPV
jgi:hypothetical protein